MDGWGKTKEQKIQEFADKLQLLLPIIDMFDEDVDELKEWLKNMKNTAEYQETIWPMFDMDALDKVDIRRLELSVFENLIALIEARNRQRDLVPKIQEKFWLREKIAKQIWL